MLSSICGSGLLDKRLTGLTMRIEGQRGSETGLGRHDRPHSVRVFAARLLSSVRLGSRVGPSLCLPRGRHYAQSRHCELPGAVFAISKAVTMLHVDRLSGLKARYIRSLPSFFTFMLILNAEPGPTLTSHTREKDTRVHVHPRP
jgi:hypothetical protein